jgi:membrane-associated HD superfamily phosphohydrolase
MEALLELIFGNFFIVLLIIVGILGFLRDNAAKQKEEERKRRSRPTKPVPQASRNPQSSRDDSRNTVRDTLEKARETISSVSVEEQQKEQMEKLADRFNTRANEKLGEIQDDISKGKSVLQEVSKADLSKEQEQIKRGVSQSLRGKGLINGIIMAEVLGPARARKPYRSVVADRRNQ